MNARRTVSLLICIFFSGLAAIGILLSPLFRMGIGITNESFLRWIHFWLSIIVLVLIIIHVVFNRKALGNYINKAKFRSVFAFSLAGVLFVGLLCWGLLGPDLGIAMGPESQLQLSGRVNSMSENSIILDTRGVNKVSVTDETKFKTQQGVDAAITDIENQTLLVVFGTLDASKAILTAKEVTMGPETQLQLVGRVDSISENTIILNIRGVNEVSVTGETKFKTQQGVDAAITDIENQTRLVVFGTLDASKAILTAEEVIILP